MTLQRVPVADGSEIAYCSCGNWALWTGDDDLDVERELQAHYAVCDLMGRPSTTEGRPSGPNG